MTKTGQPRGLAHGDELTSRTVLPHVFRAFRDPQTPAFPSGSRGVSSMGTVMGEAEAFFFIKFVCNFTARARLSTPRTGTSYTRTDNISCGQISYFPLKTTKHN